MSESSAVNATEKKSNCFNLLLRAASAALLVVATIISAALTVYYGNESECPFEISALCFPMFVMGLLLFLVLFLVQFPFKKTVYFCIANYIVFFIGVCLYFQSAWFLWDLGPLINGEFWWNWAEHGKSTIIESGLYIALIALFIWGRKWLYNNLIKLSFVIMAIEAICLSPMALTPKEDFSYMHYSIDKTNKFEFAKDKNIIICVFDCFSTPLMEEILRESPEIKDAFSDFTMYTRAITKRPLTEFAVPAIMTGENIDKTTNKVLEQCYNNENKSILLKLRNNGYKTEVYPWELSVICHRAFYHDSKLISNLIPKNDDNHDSEINSHSIQKYLYAVWLRLSPLRIKSVVSRNCCALYRRFSSFSASEQLSSNTRLPDNIQFYHELKEQARLGTEPCVFKYYHLHGVHTLYNHDENLNPLPASSPSESLTRENYLKMAKGCIRIMEELITLLKKMDVYDNSVIIFMGDHGRMEEVMGVHGEIIGEHNPMLLVKMSHEKHPQMKVSNNILLQTDICQMPLWSSPDSIDNTRMWGSDFNSKQKDERLSIWKSYQSKDLNFKQHGIFELDHNPIDVSKKILLDIRNPMVEDANLSGLIWFQYKCNKQSFILLANSKNVYSVPFVVSHNVARLNCVSYSCDVSNVMDGEYDMYFLVECTTGQKLIQFPHCKIIVKNKKPVVVNLEEE